MTSSQGCGDPGVIVFNVAVLVRLISHAHVMGVLAVEADLAADLGQHTVQRR